MKRCYNMYFYPGVRAFLIFTVSVSSTILLFISSKIILWRKKRKYIDQPAFYYFLSVKMKRVGCRKLLPDCSHMRAMVAVDNHNTRWRLAPNIFYFKASEESPFYSIVWCHSISPLHLNLEKKNRRLGEIESPHNGLKIKSDNQQKKKLNMLAIPYLGRRTFAE